MIRLFCLILFPLLLSSCSFFVTQKNCDNQDWYQIGFTSGNKGQSTLDNPLVSRCLNATPTIPRQQLDSGWQAGLNKYCQPGVAFQTGTNGEFFHFELCPNNSTDLLRKKYEEGRRKYCRNGKTAGFSGKKYNTNICSATIEKTFLPEYKTARKKFLDDSIIKLNRQIQDISTEIAQLEQAEKETQIRKSSLPTARVGDKDPYEEERRKLSQISWTLTDQISQKKDLLRQVELNLSESLAERTSLNDILEKK